MGYLKSCKENFLSPHLFNHEIEIEASHFGFSLDFSDRELSPGFLRARSYDPRVFAD